MEFLKKFKFKPIAILKVAGLAIVAIFVIVFLFNIVGRSFDSLTLKTNIDNKGMGGFNDFEMAMESMESSDIDEKMGGWGDTSLSIRNTAYGIIPPQGHATGDDAEDFEITEYNGLINTAHLDETCAIVSDLKVKDYVIFENANKQDGHSCDYRFKVKNDNADEILDIIEDLDPKELSKNSYTIKQTIDDFTNEVEVLEKKKQSIEETLENAIDAYDKIMNLATQTKDVESLAKIIDSKIKIIERLTQEKITINEQLDRLTIAKSNQLDRLDYTYFNINIYKDKYIDVDNLKDSWKMAIKNFVHDINASIQGITINLLAVIFVILQYVIYLFIMLIVVKYSWKMAKYIWQK
ncbi:MAG: hypothetical protein ABIG10_02440 [bacterium]